MRGIIGTAVCLLFAGWVGCVMELPKAWSGREATSMSKRVAADDWRHTASGWEKREQWPVATEPRVCQAAALPIHPVAIATLQGLVAVIALTLSDRRFRDVRSPCPGIILVRDPR